MLFVIFFAAVWFVDWPMRAVGIGLFVWLIGWWTVAQSRKRRVSSSG
jgi:hypothetical protein